jgi:hypothetical protein
MYGIYLFLPTVFIKTINTGMDTYFQVEDTMNYLA